MIPWCCWPPELPVPVVPFVPNPNPLAFGIIDTNAPPGAELAFGITRVLSTGVPGRVQLILATPIPKNNLIAVATPATSVDVVTTTIIWLDSTTIELQTYNLAGALTAATVRFEASFGDGMSAPETLATPLEVLGANLAVWLQGDRGTGVTTSFAPVPTWTNQVANGNAVQGANPNPPVLRLNTFGNRPGVSTENDVNAGLILTLTTPFAIGDRPYLFTRARLNQLIHTPTAFQPLALVSQPPGFINSLLFDASPSGTFGPTAFWDWETFTPGASDTFDELAELDLVPHTFQCATQQAGALVVDGTVFNAAAAIPALSAPCDTLYLSNNQPAGAPATAAGFWNMGVVIVAYTTPSALEIAQVKAWCDAYGT